MSAAASVSPTNLQQFLPNSFHSSYGGDTAQLAVASSVESIVNQHIQLSQEVTKEGANADSIVVAGGQQHQHSNGNVDEGPQFPMDEDSNDSGDEVRSKTPPLYGVSEAIPITRDRERSTSDTHTESTVTSSQTQSCEPVQEENSITYFKHVSIEFRRRHLCEGICRFEDAPHLEKTIFIKINKEKISVDVQFMPYCSRVDHGKFVTLQAYFRLPVGRKPRMKVHNVINSYHKCAARLAATVFDPQTKAVIADKESSLVDINANTGMVYLEIDKLVEHDHIIYAKTKYLVFEVRAEILCRGKISATNTTCNLDESGASAVDVVMIHYDLYK